MFNNLSPEEVNVLVRSNEQFKIPKEVVFYSKRENLADCSLDNTKHNEGWFFHINGVSYYFDPHRESLKVVLGGGSVVSKPHKVSVEGFQRLLNRELSLMNFKVDQDLWLSQYLQELPPTTRTNLLFTLLKQGFDLDLEGLISE